MPRYFFHLRSNDKALADCEGMMLASPDAARHQARQTVLDFFQPCTGRVAPEWEDWSLEVRDERGRRILFVPFTDAPDLYGASPEAPRADPSNVVNLDVVRIRRELVCVEAQMRELVRRTAQLVDHNRYEAKTLYHLMQAADETRLESAKLVARSQQQRALAGG